LLELEPEIFKCKRVVFATLGSAILQFTLMSSATLLRARVGLIARCPDISWLDVQCLTDSISFIPLFRPGEWPACCCDPAA
ncbi:hypothetical protein AB9F45_38505, partial [Rhizobium leguminosarum]